MDAKSAAKMQQLIDQVQPHCHAEVRSVLLCHHVGAMGRALTSAVSSGAGTFFEGRDAKKRAGGLPANVVLAVAADGLHAYAYKPGGWSLKPKLRIKSEVGHWPLAGMDVRTEPGTVTSRLTFTQPTTGTGFELDAPSAMGGQVYIDHFLAALRGGSDSAG
jgi:hypothetical protein